MSRPDRPAGVGAEEALWEHYVIPLSNGNCPLCSVPLANRARGYCRCCRRWWHVTVEERVTRVDVTLPVAQSEPAGRRVYRCEHNEGES